MYQLIQNLKSGETVLEEVPAPQVRAGQVLIRTRRTLVSLGTERMLVEFGKANLLSKARQQPDKVKQVFEKIQSDGLIPTLGAVFRKLDQPLPLGYCHVGEVVAVGAGITDLAIGDRVASNGHHAELVCVPRNLVASIPDGVSDDEAAFTVIGAIGLQGLRLLNPTLGETVVVVGLGLIGLLTAQLLRLNGCRVIGLDLEPAKLALAQTFGIETLNPASTDVIQAVTELTGGVGADGVVITASTKSDEVITQAARMSRKRGRIVLVGVVGLNLSRADFYEKELTFQVSCSYGPGRYDADYEQAGHDYPLPFVRWTENRNFQTILQLLSSGQLQVKPLITEVVPLTDYQQIYGKMGGKSSGAGSGGIASLLSYSETPLVMSASATVQLREVVAGPSAGVVGIIGAGNFAGSTLVPALQRAGATLQTIASANGLSGTLLAKKYGIASSTTDYQTILNDPTVDLCVITTRHNSHARLTIEALQAGKHVFVEKPLVIYDDELSGVIAAQQAADKTVTVGFNRRFSPTAQRAKALLGGDASGAVPMNVVATMNAGAIPANSWVHDRAVGGGRILGEACHYVDLITFLTGSRVISVCLNAMGQHPAETTDSASILLRYENGATGVINYFANGSKAYAKERIEVYSQERTLILDNFKSLNGYGFRGFSSISGRQDKGHTEQFRRLVTTLRAGGPPLIPFADIINTTATTLAALRSLQEGRWVTLSGEC
ncbi:bi-domain-containing oxidoreductase [Fibrella aquatilis]|uniref:Bi-domain-containing oxidoreductase n=1 Tax=Fibrella aquatilis TaxID=2817059 RepID=A0A939GAB4_9BACT|nr:bi-domain-containing oxidoreductase [Fibrella aquatilis]MBO0933569.1 bi-domain-containing oxidoreductase [Fibrella aquatilis]